MAEVSNNQRLIDLALSQIGISEVTGPMHNAEIVKYFDALGFGNMSDETAWCSAFMNWLCIELGLDHTRKLNARSWLYVGEEVDVPEIGDLVIFWRGSKEDWRGHVGLYITERDGIIYTLGGNQSNSVNIAPYPSHRVLGYRRL